jgi:hypothetical protein
MPTIPQSKIKNPKSKIPSSRDLEIYKRVRIQRELQWEVAAELRLHYTRVSQIIKRVERWLAAGGCPSDPQLNDELARRRLAHSLQKLRLERAVEIATDVLESPEEPIVKTRRRKVAGTEVWCEETTIELPKLRHRALQQFVRTAQALHELESAGDARHPAELPALPAVLPALAELLCRFRARAEATGLVPPSPDIFLLVDQTLQELLGVQTHHHSRHRQSSTRAQATLNLSAASNEQLATTSDNRTTCNQSPCETSLNHFET